MTNEFNFDGIVGPTHNYAGLAYGNIASTQNEGITANPKLAAKQGLQKMHMLMELGIPQAVLPPQQRPNLDLLRNLGFTGSNEQILNKAKKTQPQLLAACYSAASMWTANAATVSSSSNTMDGKVHITPANLIYNLHRAQEADFNYKLFNKIFVDQSHFIVHKPLLGYRDLSDEGAANHSIICSEYDRPGIELFVYGTEGLDDRGINPKLYPARQSRLASSAIARSHLLDETRTLFLQQNPHMIDAGVFHNDVIFVANKNVIFYHTNCFVDDSKLHAILQRQLGRDYHVIAISDKQLSVAEAVSTYLFNSQLVSLPGNKNQMALIVPMECKTSKRVQEILSKIIADNNPISTVKYVECRQSMLNGGGPACLRLRIVLTEKQQQVMHQGIIMNQALYNKLNTWVDQHYRDRIQPQDLLDPALIVESNTALDQLTQILNLGSIYPFQQR